MAAERMKRRPIPPKQVTVIRPQDPSPHLDPGPALAWLREADPGLGRLIELIGPFEMRVEKTRSVFHALARSIVYQQLNGKAAGRIFERLCGLFPARAEGFTPKQLLAASAQALRGAGLSGAKSRALRDLALKVEAREIPTLVEAEGLSDEVLIEQLSWVRGIGRWTVEMFLMFRLGRPDILPLDDYGVRKGFARAFRKRKLPSKRELEKRGLKWRPYRSVASWYLWRAAELPGPRLSV